jgi:tetratricopeptide (TPR) repeat protein
MIKKLLLIAGIVHAALFAFAQSLEEGKKFMYYERFNSARTIFDQLVKAKPSDAEAIYWLGQADLALGNQDAARNLYQAALQQNNHPLLLAGVGEIELREKQAEKARSRFETAITLSKSKNADVLAAIARAQLNSASGDPAYAITQLQAATGLKGVKDPGLFLLLGNAYEIQREGGNAMDAYDRAIEMDTNYAAAIYRKARILESVKAKQSYLPGFEKAIEKDPLYAPAYYSLYNYWFQRDVKKAEMYLRKYISVIDEDVQNEYYLIELKYVSSKYQEAINDADALIGKLGEANIKPRIYRRKAYSYKALGDFANARKSADEFFRKASGEEITPKDYEMYAEILAGIPGEQANAYTYYEKAIQADNQGENRPSFMQKALDLAKAQKDKLAIAAWQERIYLTKTNPGSSDLNSLGRAYFDAGDVVFDYYTKSDSVFTKYTEKNPAAPWGYYWRGRCNWSIDSTMTNAMANPHFEKFLEVVAVSPDSASYRTQIKVVYKYFIGYNVFVTKDYKKALEFCNKTLLMDPADKEALEYKNQLSGKSRPMPVAGKKPRITRISLIKAT